MRIGEHQQVIHSQWINHGHCQTINIDNMSCVSSRWQAISTAQCKLTNDDYKQTTHVGKKRENTNRLMQKASITASKPPGLTRYAWTSAQHYADVNQKAWSWTQHITTKVNALTTNTSASNKRGQWACIQQRHHEMGELQTQATIVREDTNKWVLTWCSMIWLRYTHEQPLWKTTETIACW